MSSIKSLLNEGTRLLSVPCRTASVTSPGLDAALLLAYVLDCRREDLLKNYGDPVSGADCQKYLQLIAGRISGECVAYITGHREFYSLDFIVTKDVLVPRPDTEILAEKALEYIDNIKHGNEKIPVLDLCTGSGILAITLKKMKPELEVYASDISAPALETARRNAAKLLNPEHGTVKFIQSDLFENSKLSETGTGKFRMIITNPPYVKTADIDTLSPEVRMEPKIALAGGTDGLDIIKKIIDRAKDHLHPQGILMMEADPGQMREISFWLKKSDYGEIRVFTDLAGNERVIAAGKN